MLGVSKIFLGLVVFSLFLYGCADSNQVDDFNLDNGVRDDQLNNNGGDGVVVDTSANSFDELKGLIKSSAEYKVVYDYSFENQQMVMTQYVKGDNMRTDTSVMGSESRTYILGDAVYSCMYQDGSWFCFVLNGSSTDYDESFELDDPLSEDIDSFEGDVRKLPSRTIAGVVANCFEVLEESISYVYCYSSNGVPLLLEGGDGSNSWSMVAREFSLSVSNNDFSLPAEASSLEDMMGAWGFPTY